ASATRSICDSGRDRPLGAAARRRYRRPSMTRLLALALLLAPACAHRVPPPPAPAPAVAAAADEGWRPLFDGHGLDASTTTGSAMWRVEDGVIVGGQDGDPKRSGLLATRETFTDFDLQLDFMIDEHCKYNSDVYLRNQPGARGRTGYQVNIGRGAVGEFCV